ncbi:MAG: MerC domain-containing protein [Pseudomonadota bacterium]
MRDQAKNLRPIADKAAIGLSALCAVHCLAVPIIAVTLPSLAAMGLADESFHIWLVIFVIPFSAFALTLGCTKHRNMTVLFLGVLGMICLCLGPILGHDVLGENGERLLTLAGATLIAVSHIRNFTLCRDSDGRECQDARSEA